MFLLAVLILVGPILRVIYLMALINSAIEPLLFVSGSVLTDSVVDALNERFKKYLKDRNDLNFQFANHCIERFELESSLGLSYSSYCVDIILIQLRSKFSFFGIQAQLDFGGRE